MTSRLASAALLLAVLPGAAQAAEGEGVLYEQDGVKVSRSATNTCHLVSSRGPEFFEFAVEANGVMSLWVRASAFALVPYRADKQILWLSIPGQQSTAIEMSMREDVNGFFQFAAMYENARPLLIEPLRQQEEITVSLTQVGSSTFAFPNAEEAIGAWSTCIEGLPKPAQ